MRSDRPRKAVLAVVAVLTSGGVGTACPFPSNGSLLAGGDDAVLEAPEGDFRHEISRILARHPVDRPIRPVQSDARAVRVHRLAADIADAARALDIPESDSSPVLQQLRDMRSSLDECDDAKFMEGGVNAVWVPSALQAPVCDPRPVPAGLPVEIADYLRGAYAYRRGKIRKARTYWNALLARPEAARRERSTWAAFMLGRSYVDEQPRRAVAWLRYTRRLAARGFADRLNLAAESVGWEARANLRLGRIASAIDTYLAQDAGGDPAGFASLKIVARRVFAVRPVDGYPNTNPTKYDDTALRAAARNPDARRVLTAYLIATTSPEFGRRVGEETAAVWLEAVEASGARVVDDADRLAWAAYQTGRMDLAERWVAVAPAESPIARWIDAKLLLRAGRIEAARERFAAAAAMFAPDERWNRWADWEGLTSPAERAAAELGVVLLAKGDYTSAIDAFLIGSAVDANWTAERVLTIDELKAYIDDEARWPETRSDQRAQLRATLARRLARAGRWKDALVYFPADVRPRAAEYSEAITLGRSRGEPARRRGRALWHAARVFREHGSFLTGSFAGGSRSIADGRSRARLVAAGADERERVGRHGVAWKRYNDRYAAADLAWEAAALIPDHSEEQAAILCHAGSWLKFVEPKAADRFYKALVRRCGRTRLGREAAARRWFPDCGAEEPADETGEVAGPGPGPLIFPPQYTSKREAVVLPGCESETSEPAYCVAVANSVQLGIIGLDTGRFCALRTIDTPLVGGTAMAVRGDVLYTCATQRLAGISLRTGVVEKTEVPCFGIADDGKRLLVTPMTMPIQRPFFVDVYESVTDIIEGRRSERRYERSSMSNMTAGDGWLLGVLPSEGAVEAIDLESGRPYGVIRLENWTRGATINGMSLPGDGSLVVLTSVGSVLGNHVVIFDAKTGKRRAEHVLPPMLFTGLACVSRHVDADRE